MFPHSYWPTFPPMSPIKFYVNGSVNKYSYFSKNILTISVNYGSRQNVADIKFILSNIVMGPINIITKIDTCMLICSSISRCVNYRYTQNVELWYIMGSVMTCGNLTSTIILLISLESSFMTIIKFCLASMNFSRYNGG